MKRAPFFTLLMFCLIFPYSLLGQVVDSTVCNILANPQSFDGKIVRIKGTVVAGFEEFAVKGQSCNQSVNAIWLAYPNGTNAKAGPAALLRLQIAKNSPAVITNVARAPIPLVKDKNFENFDMLLSTAAKTHGICLGCLKYDVSAVLVGRLDAAISTGLVRNSQGGVTGLGGFGNLNRYRARLVLQMVSEVTPEKINYANEGAAASSNAPMTNQSFKPGTPTADQVKQALDAYGAEGEDNGVTVSFGSPNEVPQNDTSKSNGNSPDGVIFHVAFDSNRLKGAAMQIAMAHVGTHIADIRSKDIGLRNLSFYAEEYRAWQTSVLMAAGRDLKTLTLPDGFTIYNKSWPNSELGANANAGISGFLAAWASIGYLPGQ